MSNPRSGTGSGLAVGEIGLEAAEVGSPSPLPPFGSTADLHARITPVDIPAEDSRYVGYGNVASPLPYLMQDGYARVRSTRSFRAVVLRNERLRATFLPEVGGRLWSLEDLRSGRELLFRNPVFQPANLAIRNAWVAGGVEWNISVVGHCPFTCSNLFAGRLETSDGTPVLRMWEWERIRGVAFQIDAWLPAGSPVLLIAVRIVNPNAFEVPMYWWSNTAVPETPGTRVIAPAVEAYTFAYGGQMRRVPIPIWENLDRTYPARGPQAADYFYRVPDGERGWIAAVEPDGRGLFQTSTDFLRGRKLFLWGAGAGGRRWQEYLSEPGCAYLEIQAGLARTQAEHLPMPAGATWSWLEAYGALDVDPAAAGSEDWARARSAVSRAVEATVRRERLEQELRGHERCAATPPREVLNAGSGWGALEARRCRLQGRPSPIPAGILFDESTLGPEQEAWLGLLERGVLRGADEQASVRGIEVSPEWREYLERSLASGGARPGAEDWLAWYHGGIARAHAGDVDRAATAFEESLRRRVTPWSLRGLAVLHRSRGDLARSAELYVRALTLDPGLRPLAVECGQALLEAGRPAEWLRLAGTLPAAIRSEGRVRLLGARAWLALGRLEEVERFLADPPEIADMREGEVSLSDLWFLFHEASEAGRVGRALEADERLKVRREHPPPRSIDFRMSAE